jgi:hypothetical protein
MVCPYSREELVEGCVIPELVCEVEDEFPGIRAVAPLRDVVLNALASFSSGLLSRSDSTRSKVDTMRAALEALTP